MVGSFRTFASKKRDLPVTDVTVSCLDEAMSETDDALDQDVATMVAVLMDRYREVPDAQVHIAAALVRAALRVCHDYHPEAYFHFLGRMMLTTHREFDGIADWMERHLDDTGT